MSNDQITDPAVIRRARNVRHIFGLLTALAIIASGPIIVGVPVMDPGPLHPIARLLNYKIDECSRTAYIRAHLGMGYVLTPKIRIDLDALRRQ